MVRIIIVTYNAMPWLFKCLESTKPFSVVVIDNNSTDETVRFIKENYPSITILAQKENLGFGQANNIGMSYALKHGADYVFLLNQDAYLENDTIEKLIEVHRKDENFGVLSPIHLNGKGDRLDQNFSNYLNYNANPDFYSDFVEISPSVTILGGCIIDSYSQIGVNTTILPDIKIEKNVIIGAGSVVTTDIPDNCVAIGIPARIIKELTPSEF